MPASTNSIGQHDFIALLGVPQPPRTLLEVDQRAAVDGTQFTDIGKKGVPFRLLSRVDATDYAAAQAKVADYLALTAEGSVSVTQGGYTLPYQCKVLNVEPITVRALRAAIGGLNSPSNGWIEAAWDLIATDT